MVKCKRRGRSWPLDGRAPATPTASKLAVHHLSQQPTSLEDWPSFYLSISWSSSYFIYSWDNQQMASQHFIVRSSQLSRWNNANYKNCSVPDDQISWTKKILTFSTFRETQISIGSLKCSHKLSLTFSLRIRWLTTADRFVLIENEKWQS